MLLIVKAICKDCYIKKYGELPTEKSGKRYEITDEIGICEKCGKECTMIYTVVPMPKSMREKPLF